MDPLRRAVIDYELPDNIDEITDREAYEIARIKGYTFIGTRGIGRLSEDELYSIANHPPKVTFSEWLNLRELDIDELVELYPEIVWTFGEGSLWLNDVFMYATRGYVPSFPHLGEKIQRWKEYNELSFLGKNLMDEIYKNEDTYINEGGNILEEYVKALDKNMDNSTVINQLASRMGFTIPANLNRYDRLQTFVDRFTYHVRNYESNGITHRYHTFNSEDGKRLPNTKEIIDMTEDEFRDFAKSLDYKLSDEDINNLYYNRLMFLNELYNNIE